MEGLWIFLIICVIWGTISKFATTKIKHKDSGVNEDDARTMQEINRGLQRMEDRIDALETLLMDKSERRPSRHNVE